MRKLTFMLPVTAILLAAVVVAAEFGSPLAAQSPDSATATTVKDEDYYLDDEDVNAVTWAETSVRVPDSTKPRLPNPKVKFKPKKKKKK